MTTHRLFLRHGYPPTRKHEEFYCLDLIYSIATSPNTVIEVALVSNRTNILSEG